MQRSLIGIALFIVAACVDPASPEASADMAPLCQVGCVEVDPNPSAPGYFLGSGVDPDMCFDDIQTDADQDNLGDFCEKELAASFAPQLRYWGFDNVRRQSYWAARPLGDGSVVIAYLLGYFVDTGSQAYVCQLPPPISEPSCNGHVGDPEAVYLTLAYNNGTNHWELRSAAYAQHENDRTYTPGICTYYSPPPTNACALLEFPNKFMGAPRVYVSQGKHASYAAQAECNSGGIFDTDTCTSVNTNAWVAAGNNRQIGSRWAQVRNCVLVEDTFHPYYSAHAPECFWTGSRFRGWHPQSVGGLDADPYTSKLMAHGF